MEKNLDSLFTFLHHLGADATNWRGEQAIRPAVVNRKVWGGNRTEVRALARSRIMSVMHTCKQRLADPFDFIRRQLTATSLPCHSLSRHSNQATLSNGKGSEPLIGVRFVMVA
nr:transposase [Neorhodopirellula lusitana]